MDGFRSLLFVSFHMCRSLFMCVGLFCPSWCQWRYSIATYIVTLRYTRTSDLRSCRIHLTLLQNTSYGNRSLLYVSFHVCGSLSMCVGLFSCVWVSFHVCGSLFICVGLFSCVWVSFVGALSSLVVPVTIRNNHKYHDFCVHEYALLALQNTFYGYWLL